MNVVPVCKDHAMTYRGGAVRGVPQAHRRASYDPSTGRPWRTGVALPPDAAMKVIEAADKAGLSFAGLVTELIMRMETDDNGAPVWIASKQEELPKAG